MQRPNMTLQQYADDLVAKLCMVTGGYDDGTLHTGFMKGSNESTRHGLRHYWVWKPQVNLPVIVLQTESVLSTQKKTLQPPKQQKK